MVNYAVLQNIEDKKNVAIVAHDYTNGKIIYKAKNKYISDLLDLVFNTKNYRLLEENDLEIKQEVKKYDKDLLEIILPKIVSYKVSEFYEDIDKNINELIDEQFKELV